MQKELGMYLLAPLDDSLSKTWCIKPKQNIPWQPIVQLEVSLVHAPLKMFKTTETHLFLIPFE